MKKRKKFLRTTALLTACVLAVTAFSAPPSLAAKKDGTSLSDLQNSKQKAEKKVNDAQNAVNDATANKQSLESQADSVAKQIYAAQDSIASTSSDINKLQAELSDAHEKENTQYQAMKKRIQYMYEVGTDNILVIILASDNFTDFLNKFEYAAEITKYDQNMIDEYKTLEDTIASKNKQLKSKQEQLEQTQTDLSNQQNELSGLLANADDSLKAKYADLLGAQQDLADINEAIKDFQSALASEEKANAASKAAAAVKMADSMEQSSDAQGEAEAKQKLDAANAAVNEAKAQKEAADRANAAAQAAAQKAAAEKAARDKAAQEAAAAAEAAKQKAAADAAAKQKAAEEAARQKAEADAAAQKAAADAAAAQKAAQQAANTLSQRQAEQKAADQWMKNKSWKTTNPYGQVGKVYYVTKMSYSQKDLDELTTMLYCEAGGEGYNGQLAVASVILNRVRSSMFPGSIHGVMFASGQFEPTWLRQSGKWGGKTMFQYFYDNRAYMQQHYSAWRNCRQAALDALNGKRNTNLCFYWAKSNSRPTGSIVYGNQVFFGRVVQNS